jgi:hypothetical protein
MAAKLTFLQGSVDDTPKTSNAGSGRNTDHIRQMLREQQRSMGALHANALFREFRGDGQKKAFGKGYVAVADTAERPMIDDFQAEGQARMFDLIRQTAVKDEKPLRGVWASFGKPYICLGEPADVSMENSYGVLINFMPSMSNCLSSLHSPCSQTTVFQSCTVMSWHR